MAQAVNVNFKLDADVKKSMEQVCSELGLSMSAAFTIFAKKVGREKRIPFEVSVDPFYSESNIRYLENMLKTATIVSDKSSSDEVGMDDIVEVYFEEDDEIEKYKLVTSIRGNSMENRISIDSPIGMALKGHKIGDRVEVKVNDNYSYFLEIRSIDKTHSEEEEIRGF